MERVDCEDFYCGHNREIIETIFSLYSDKKEVNRKTVLNELLVRGLWNEDVRHFLEHIAYSTSTSGNELLCCDVVKGYAAMRRLMLLEDSIRRLISEEPDKAHEKIQMADQMCRTVLDYQSKEGFLPVGELMGNVFKSIVDRSDGNENSKGLLTGYPCIDRNTGDLYPKEIALVAARPAMGKTSFGLNIALNVARNSGKTVAFFSAEQNRNQIVCRLLSMEGSVSAKRIMNGQLSDEEWGRLASAVSSLDNLDIRINDNESLSVEEITSQCYLMDNLGLIVIDYLQLMEKDRVMETKKELAKKCSKISKKIKVHGGIA